MKCMVKNCQNYKGDGGFEDGICLPCYNFITTNEPNNSQAYENTNLVKEIKNLTDGELPVLTLKINGRLTLISFSETRIICDSLVEQLRKAQK